MPNIDDDRMVLTPGIPNNAVVRGYVTCSWISFGERPIQSVAMICWLSPMSGIASTATGLRGMRPLCQLKGTVDSPPTMININTSAVIKRLWRKYPIILCIECTCYLTTSPVLKTHQKKSIVQSYLYNQSLFLRKSNFRFGQIIP